ncbi:PEP-CTERM sorting domain-containing protein [Roseateles sp. BYS78W]|uniref:PEP-CTERM sorting domain-containing protein n=1 Tax=Pelomonas candidula TaxID=3299025 RepID=A0ABW7HDW3_9BURK
MRFLATLLLAAAFGPATAAVITFDGYQPRYDYSQTTLVTDGFSFTEPCQCLGVDDQPPHGVLGNLLPGAYNGTASLLYSANPLGITAVDGAAFFLARLDLGLSWYVPNSDVGSVVTVSYLLAGGGSGSVSAALERSYSTLEIDQEVLSVSISGGRGLGYISLDNLVVNNQVPEPESVGLALLALLSAGAALRRRPQASA